MRDDLQCMLLLIHEVVSFISISQNGWVGIGRFCFLHSSSAMGSSASIRGERVAGSAPPAIHDSEAPCVQVEVSGTAVEENGFALTHL